MPPITTQTQIYPEFAIGQHIITSRGSTGTIEGRAGDWTDSEQRHRYLVRFVGLPWTVPYHVSQLKPADTQP